MGEPVEKRCWDSLSALERWLQRNDFQGFDPFDGLLARLRPLTFGRRIPQQVLQQFVRRNPFNLRPLLGIKPHRSTKGMGFLASGYSKLHRLRGDDRYKEKAEWCYRWLRENHTPGYAGLCWGNAFDYVSRAFVLPKGQPTLVWTSLIGHHLVEGFRTLGNPQYLEDAESAARFVLNDLPRVHTPHGTCLSYIVHEPVAVHNANLLGARFLSDLYRETGRAEYRDVAEEAVRYSVHCQRSDGAWFYGEEPKYHWVDNWHTAYNLDSILEFQQNTGSRAFSSSLEIGLEFYVSHFFMPDGAPKYYADRAYKYDIQSASQSIDTLTLFAAASGSEDLLALARKVARWTIENMQAPEGYFYLWKNSWFTNTTPTFHWGAATMFHALAHLLTEVERREH
jgi:rhamnogalacturonyl hydrolase YesR